MQALLLVVSKSKTITGVSVQFIIFQNLGGINYSERSRTMPSIIGHTCVSDECATLSARGSALVNLVKFDNNNQSPSQLFFCFTRPSTREQVPNYSALPKQFFAGADLWHTATSGR